VFLERELSTPLADTERFMSRLALIKRAVGTQHNLLAPEAGEAAIGPRGPQEPLTPDMIRSQFGEQRARAEKRLDELEALEAKILGPAQAVRSNLRTRLEAAYSAADQWLAALDNPEPPETALRARAEALDELFNLHELIERIEGQSLADARIALQHGEQSRNAVIALTAAMVGAAALTGLLGLILVRRWVLIPVARLRTAAERFGAGDLEYRLDVTGGDELALLSAEINEMAAALAANQKERIESERLAAIGDMTRRIVHNIRSPLNGVRMLAELTRMDLPDHSALRENQDRIVNTVDRFEAWIGELLTLTRPLELTLRPQDCPAWAAAAIETLRPAAEARGCSLELAPSPVQASFDAPRLEQALVALVANAIEASPAGGRVTVEVGPDDGAAGLWRFAVLDQGPGIDPTHAADLFRPYFTTKEKGNGIGLAMAHRVVREHGGTLRAEAAPGGGAAFVAQIPVSPPSPEASRGPATV
jgi:signal transduction histidine kinase